MNEQLLLVSRYLDGELNDADVGALATALRDDPQLVDRLVVGSFIHSQLLSWLNQDTSHTNKAGVAASYDSSRPTNDELFVAARLRDSISRSSGSSWPDPVARSSATRLRPWAVIAALLFIATSISGVGYFIATRPTIVGQLTESKGARWNGAEVPPRTGALLHNGQKLVLNEGSAVITFASGARLYLEGPTSLQLSSSNELQLLSGKIAARVPRQAVGFAVTNSLGRVVDLGTAFTLSLKAEKSFELYVFEGLVELQLDERFGAAAHQPVRVAQVHALAFDVNSGDISPIEFKPGTPMPFK